MFVLLLVLAVFFGAPLASAQGPDHAMHAGHGDQHMSMSSLPLDPAAQAAYEAKLRADKRESEFNHHLAGMLVIVAGVFLLAERPVRRRWPFVRFAWPICFLSASLFLLVFSDTELWPFGRMSWWYGLTHRPEDLQHKTFALILLAVGFIEIQRARGALKTAWSGWVLPAIAAFGSVLLLFHEHHIGTHGDHMAIMRRIQSQHLSFCVTGLGIALTSGLSRFRVGWQSMFAKLWPVLMLVLGVLLLLYRE